MATKVKRPRDFNYFLIFILFAISFLAKLKFNGLVYGLDFGLYHPDGSLYTFRTLTWLGHSQAEAGVKVSNWYLTHSFKSNQIDPSSLEFDKSPHWEVYRLRILYPALSVPFVALIGIPGMLVIPALSMLTLLICTYVISKELGAPRLGLVLVTFFSFSITISRWMYVNTADSLLVALTCLSVIAIMNFSRNNKAFLALIVLSLLSSATRFSLFILIAIAISIAWQKFFYHSALLVTVAIIGFLPHLFVNYAPAVLASQSQLSIPEKIIRFPHSIIRVGFYEIAQLAVLDRYLLVFLLLASILSVLNRSSYSARVFFLALTSLWLTGALNGVIGVNFRYQLPLLPFAVLVIVNHKEILGRFFQGQNLKEER